MKITARFARPIPIESRDKVINYLGKMCGGINVRITPAGRAISVDIPIKTNNEHVGSIARHIQNLEYELCNL